MVQAAAGREEAAAGREEAQKDIAADLTEARLSLDLPRLQRHLAEHVPQLPLGQGGPGDLQCSQFGSGTSNPTYLLWSAKKPDARCVLRRKPPGELLVGAHQIDREYRVQKALEGSGVPVPLMHHFCSDNAVLGAPFYVMDCIGGSTFPPVGRAEAAIPPAKRTHVWASLVDAAAALHAVDFRAVGLGDFAKVGNYTARQLKTWSRQFKESVKVVDKVAGLGGVVLHVRIDAAHQLRHIHPLELCLHPKGRKVLPRPELVKGMDELYTYLDKHMVQEEPTCIVHGDLGIHNAIVNLAEARVVAILDWELSTLGHPMIDLNYMLARLPGGYRQCPDTEGLPAQWEFVERYHERRGIPLISRSQWDFFSLVNAFRWTGIVHGVYARILQGQSSTSNADTAWWEEIVDLGRLVEEAVQKIRGTASRL